MSSIIDAQTTTVLCTHALGSITLYWGCQRALSLHLQRLGKKNAQPAATTPPASRSRWTSKWITTAVITGVLCIVGTSVTGLSWFASRTVKDWVYMGMSLGHITLSFEWFLRKGISTDAIDVYSIPRHAVLTLSAGLVAMSIGAVYTGHQWALSPLVAITAFSTITGQQGHARSIRSQIKWIVLMPVGCLATCGIIFGWEKWYSRLTALTVQSRGSSIIEIASPEVAFILSMFSAVMPLSVPGTLLAITLQYEHKSARKTREVETAFDADTPLYRVGLHTYILILIALCGAELFAGKEVIRALRGIHSVCLTSLPIVARLVILVRQQGLYDDFMGYGEKYESGCDHSKGDSKQVTQADEEHAFAPVNDIQMEPRELPSVEQLE